MIEFRASLSGPTSHLPHSWEHTVGSDHATMALRADWREQITRSHRELGFRHVRFHGLLSDDVGTLVQEQEKRIDSFFNADAIVDSLLSIGMRPFIELSFMPEALASGHKTVFHYRANVTPPKSYREWGNFVYRLMSHWKDRYGRDELRRWFFEVWNEPNLGVFWRGSRNDYFRLYRHAAEAIKRVDASLPVGGPATAKNSWIEEFLEFCDSRGVPADFVSTHHYPNDALADVEEDTEAQLAGARRGILREEAQRARRQAAGRPLYYTEWNAATNPRHPLHDRPYAAAFVVKTALEAAPLVAGYSFWTFTDIFEETYFPSEPFHGGFGLLTLHGIPKPTYRAFELLHALGKEQLLVDGLHETVDAWVVRSDVGVTVLLTNHALPGHPIADEQVEILLSDAPRPRSVFIRRIDQDHANPRRLWEERGRPPYLKGAEIERLEEASRLLSERGDARYEDGTLEIRLGMPPHGVAAVSVEFAR